MKQKSFGQVAYDAWDWPETKWEDHVFQDYWNKSAKAVIREYLKRQKSKKKKGAKK